MEQWHAQYRSVAQHQPTRGEFKGSDQQLQPASNNSYSTFQASPATSHGPSAAASPYGSPADHNADADVAMQDVDSYGRGSYTRPAQQRQVSAVGGRAVSQYGPSEDSTAARKYSPMDTLSPSTPLSPASRAQNQHYVPSHASQTHGSRQSPSRPQSYVSPSQSYYPSSGGCIFICS